MPEILMSIVLDKEIPHWLKPASSIPYTVTGRNLYNKYYERDFGGLPPMNITSTMPDGWKPKPILEKDWK